MTFIIYLFIFVFSPFQHVMQRLTANGYRLSRTNTRLVHADLCTGVNDLIPDTNGRGGAPNSKGGGGGGGGSGGGIGSFFRGLFTFILVGGILLVVAGLAWGQCMSEEVRGSAATIAERTLGLLGGLLGVVLDKIVEAWDWVRGRLAGVSALRGIMGDSRAAYEPLAGGLDAEEEDFRSPPLYREEGP
jgi:hypothetical protein